MKDKLILLCILILLICLLITKCNWVKQNPPIVKIGKTDTVTVQLPPVITTTTKFVYIHNTDTVFRNLPTLDSSDCNEVKESRLYSDDSLVRVDLVYRGELLRSTLTQTQLIKYVNRTDTLVKSDKTWNVNAGGFVTRSTDISGGVMLGLRIKNINVGVMLDPFQNRSGVYFTMGLR
jgi:hypothetical protein